MWGSTAADGNNGVFIIPVSDFMQILCIASDGMGWQHVSASIKFADPKKPGRCPYWEEMCKIKDLFWDAEDCVVQYHPPASEYVNCHPHCLHLWKPDGVILPLPDSIMVGPK
jgi:hypothetical protein